jgi:hypothetical protein
MNIDRKAVTAAYKEKKAEAGIYAFHAPSLRAAWVGASPTLDTVERRLRFTLRSSGPCAAGLAAAYAELGDEGLRFEVLERFDPELTALTRQSALRDRARHWRAVLGAGPV